MLPRDLNSDPWGSYVNHFERNLTLLLSRINIETSTYAEETSLMFQLPSKGLYVTALYGELQLIYIQVYLQNKKPTELSSFTSLAS